MLKAAVVLASALAAFLPARVVAVSSEAPARNNPAFADTRPGAAWSVKPPDIVPAVPRRDCSRKPGDVGKAGDDTIYNDGETVITMHGAIAVDIGVKHGDNIVSHHRTAVFDHDVVAERCP
ncbi:MAG: hypothetical protein P4L82_06845 [Ancalomicrobiaceae bacterium]|nr:hypothetical protein [Ancalomicrobiaceae bacterium]